MDINPIKTEKQYQMYLREIKRLENKIGITYRDQEIITKLRQIRERKKLNLFKRRVNEYKNKEIS